MYKPTYCTVEIDYMEFDICRLAWTKDTVSNDMLRGYVSGLELTIEDDGCWTINSIRTMELGVQNTANMKLKPSPLAAMEDMQATDIPDHVVDALDSAISEWVYSPDGRDATAVLRD